MDPALVDALASGLGRTLLAGLPPYDEASALTLQTRLRAEGHDPDLVSAALAQSRLRSRARARLGDRVDRLLLTRDGVEQATRPAVAADHAARFRAAGVGAVDDWGCGLGLDALAFLDAGLGVRGVEADPVVAAMARANLATADSGAASQVLLGTVEEHAARLTAAGADLTGRGAWFDPARRQVGHADARGRTRRTSRLDQLSPAWETVQEVAVRYPAAGAKLAPSFRPAWLPDGTEGVWTSAGRTVVECAVWWGDAAHAPGPVAVLLDERTGTRLTLRPGDGERLRAEAPAATPEESLHDPDPAVLQAGLVGEVETATGGRELGPGVGYVLSPDAVAVPWARRYRVDERLPATTKVLRRYVRDRGWTGVVLKARGTRADPEALRRDLRPGREARRADGATHEGTLVLTTEAGRSVVFAVTPR